jgi:capsular polysaccharide transport system permease protein
LITGALNHRNDLWRSLVIQARVVGALVMREIITRYGRHNIGFMWVLSSR